MSRDLWLTRLANQLTQVLVSKNKTESYRGIYLKVTYSLHMYMHTHKLELQHTDIHIHKNMCSHLYFKHKHPDTLSHTHTHTIQEEKKSCFLNSSLT